MADDVDSVPWLGRWWDIEDRALQWQLYAFGEPVTVYFGGAPPEGVATRGIFDAPPEHADLGLQRDVSDQGPWVAFRVAELPSAKLPRLGDRVGIRGVDWEINDIAPDGSLHVKCRLFRLGDWQPVPPPPVTPPAPEPVPLMADSR